MKNECFHYKSFHQNLFFTFLCCNTTYVEWWSGISDAYFEIWFQIPKTKISIVLVISNLKFRIIIILICFLLFFLCFFRSHNVGWFWFCFFFFFPRKLIWSTSSHMKAESSLVFGITVQQTWVRWQIPSSSFLSQDFIIISLFDLGSLTNSRGHHVQCTT